MDLTKNKKRGERRKRNLIARDLKTNPLYRPKRVEGKGRMRKRIRVEEVERYLIEEEEDYGKEDTKSVGDI